MRSMVLISWRLSLVPTSQDANLHAILPKTFQELGNRDICVAAINCLTTRTKDSRTPKLSFGLLLSHPLFGVYFAFNGRCSGSSHGAIRLHRVHIVVAPLHPDVFELQRS